MFFSDKFFFFWFLRFYRMEVVLVFILRYYIECIEFLVISLDL